MKTRIAIASKGFNGLDDIIPDVFGRAPAFTIIDMEDNIVKNIKTEKNLSYELAHGAGPLICTKLIKLDTNIVIASEFGPTVSSILKEAQINQIKAKPGTKVKDAIKEFLKKD
ncbi:NifB/NifX family molybdenum-iron cluster-binding protein [Thermoproteota archaeon]